MSAEIIQFVPRANPRREAEQAVEAMFRATWAPFFLLVADIEQYTRGLALDLAPSEPDDCA